MPKDPMAGRVAMPEWVVVVAVREAVLQNWALHCGYGSIIWNLMILGLISQAMEEALARDTHPGRDEHRRAVEAVFMVLMETGDELVGVVVRPLLEQRARLLGAV